MGGRRSKTLKNIFGTDANLRSPKIRLTSALNKKKGAEEIASSTVDLVSMSKLSASHLAKTAKFIDAIVKKISKEKKSFDLEEGRRIANDLWTDIKKKENIKTPKELDEIIVSSAADVLKRRRKW